MYAKLFQVFNKILNKKIADDEWIIAYLLGQVSQEREACAYNFIKIYESNGQIINCIISLIKREVASAESVGTLFRANSMGSKIVDAYMKTVGMQYLKSILFEVINHIVDNKIDVELDPNRFPAGLDIESARKTNMKNLEKIMDKIIGSIVSAKNVFPK